jgi:hypothetical protein
VRPLRDVEIRLIWLRYRLRKTVVIGPLVDAGEEKYCQPATTKISADHSKMVSLNSLTEYIRKGGIDGVDMLVS